MTTTAPYLVIGTSPFNVSETVVKAMKERFGIALADSEIAIEPDRISDCTEWVSARILDRNALYEAKQEKRRVA